MLCVEVQKDIFGLDVPMDDVLLVEEAEAADGLVGDAADEGGLSEGGGTLRPWSWISMRLRRFLGKYSKMRKILFFFLKASLMLTMNSPFSILSMRI